MREELLKGLTEEQINKFTGCKSPEDVLSVAKAEGIELTDEQLEAVSGGGCDYFEWGDKDAICPRCNSKNSDLWIKTSEKHYIYKYTCLDCGWKWTVT